jgi:hypothetical protein
MITKIAAAGFSTTILSLLLTFCFYWQNCTNLFCLSEIHPTNHQLLLWGVFSLNGCLLFFFYHVWYKEKKGYFFWNIPPVDHQVLDSEEKIISPKATSIDTSKYDAQYDLVRTLCLIAILIPMGLIICSILLSHHLSISGSLFRILSPLHGYILMGIFQFILSLWITLSGFPLNNPYPYRVN